MCGQVMPHNPATCPCNCCKPEVRRAKRALKVRAERVAAVQGIAPVTPAVPEQPADLVLEQQRALAADLRTVYDEHTARTISPEAVQEWLAGADARAAMRKELEQTYGSPEAAVRALGASVLSAAEQYAGVSVEEVRRRDQERRASIDEELGELATFVALTEADIEERHNLAELGDELDEAFEEMITYPDDEERSARYDRADDAYEAANLAARAEKEAQTVPVRERMAALEKARHQNLPHPDTAADLRALADGYQRALSDVRDLGGHPDLSQDSDDLGAHAVRDAAQIFPADWIAAHNTWGGSEMVAAQVLGRAYYNDGFKSAGKPPRLATSASPVRAAGRSATFATTAHELTHRFEAVVPGLAQMEEDFLKRRTTTDGQRDELVSMAAPMEGEMTRPDNFVNAYMGRHYGDGFHEVMSCGVEAAFGGAFGGLIGTCGKPADIDMLHFVLGAMASAGAPSGETAQTAGSHEHGSVGTLRGVTL